MLPSCHLFSFLSALTQESTGECVFFSSHLFDALNSVRFLFSIRLGIAFSIVASAMLVGNPISGALIGTTGHFAWGPAVIFNGVSGVSLHLIEQA